jgi:hypothetical protein
VTERDEVRAYLGLVRRRWFAQAALRTVARGAFAAAVPGLAALVIERLFRPTGPELVLLGGAALVAALGAAAFAVWHMQRRPNDTQVARFVEERAALLPGVAPLDDSIVSAVDGFSEGTPLRPLLRQAAVRRLAEFTPSQIVPPAAIRRGLVEATAGLALLGFTLVLGRAPLARSFQTAWLGLNPHAIQISVQPGDVRVIGGSPLQIRAFVHSGNRPLTHLQPTMTVSAAGDERRVPMTVEGGAFVFPFESVDRSFTYKIGAGGASTRDFTVTAIFAPRVERIDLHYEYPSFTGLRPRDEQNGGDIYAPAGTKVLLRVQTDKPIAAAEMTMAGAGSKPLRAAGERTAEIELVLARDDSYRLRLTDRDGLGSPGDTEYFIRLMDDRPPDVRILRPAGDQQITPLEEVAIEARAEDDYGIANFELVYAVPGGQSKVVPFTHVSGTEVARLGAHLLAAEDLRVKPGDVITYYARARDVSRGKRSTETRSDMYFLEVRPFNEEFVEAQSQGSGPNGAQIETLIAAQKEIINATWNIERRSGVGRSQEDLKAVADAQAELKARAEQMGSPRRGRGPIRPPLQIVPQQPPVRQPAQDPVGDAAQAMGRALEQLQGQRTSEALPHEMAALQALLRAQAEIRRREVMRQQANAGAGGSGRQGQDLSALFDKELQRQQRTNYESRSQVEERPDQKDQSDALDRIRDLARRQEELSRKQREAAGSDASEEERKRQLERLTREQAELRDQAEKLARQMEQQGGQQAAQRPPSQTQSGQQGQQQTGQTGNASGNPRQGQPGNASGRMQDASEQMRNATNELQRNDAKAAADQSARAAEQLRSLEQQMRGGSPEARQRAAGELQLEAQQIADEQRRIAAEAGRLEKGDSSATADARRRLAGEKDRLAERVDSLQRGVGELAKGEQTGKQTGASAGRAGEAAKELERQEIGRRMREGAKQMRDGSAQASRGGAAGEEELARSMDRVADLLGASSAEARGLSSQLEQTRDIRERLDRLERQIRDAEGKEAKAQGRGTGRDATAGRAGEPGQQGRPNSSGSSGGAADKELERLREEYARELQRASELLGKLQQSAPRSGLGGRTPEQAERSQADPGNQPFKQDYSGWESLRKDVDLALERTEQAVSARISQQKAQDRLSAGGSDRVPDAYRRLIARYYEALARSKK